MKSTGRCGTGTYDETWRYHQDPEKYLLYDRYRLCNMDDAVRANTRVIERAEPAAVGFVQEITRSIGLQRNVSYSGGKDSLATLLVVTKALGKTPLLFADTGFEFPETYENIDAVSQHYRVNVVKTNGQTRFQELFDRHDPPAVNARVVL